MHERAGPRFEPLDLIACAVTVGCFVAIVLGKGTPEVYSFMMIVLAFYFGGRTKRKQLDRNARENDE